MSVQALSCAFAIRGISSSEKLVLLALANFANDQMQCWPSQERLASDTELSARTVWGALKSLEEKGVVERTTRTRADGSRTTDVFTLHFSLRVWSEPVAEFASRPRNICEGASQPLREGLAAVATLTTFEPSLEPSIEPDDGDARAPDWDARLEEAKRVGGDALDMTQASLWTYRDLRLLCEPRSGEPCEWGEVLDAIRFRAAKVAAGGQKIRSWTWVRDQALAYRDRRLAGLRAPEAQATGPPNSFTDRIAADNAEARRRAFEMLDAQDGPKN